MRNFLLIIIIFKIYSVSLTAQSCDVNPSAVTFEDSDKTILSTYFANETFIAVNATDGTATASAIIVLDSANIILTIESSDDTDCIDNYILSNSSFPNTDIHQFYQLAEINYDSLESPLAVGQSVDSLSGCFALSNVLRVNDIELSTFVEIVNVQSSLNSDHLNVFGGAVSLNRIIVSNTRALDVCLIDTLNRSFDILGAVGPNLVWVVTSRMGEVIDIVDSPPFNFSAYALMVESNTLLHEIELYHISTSGGDDWLTIGSNIKSDFCGSATRNQSARFDINFIECESTCTDGFLNGEEEDQDVCASDSTLVCNIININNVSCFGLADGSVEVELSSGFGPFDYIWDNGDTTAVAENLDPGIYNVTVSDDGGRITECIAAINQPDSLAVTISLSFGVSCAASAIPSGGLDPYTYLWSSGETLISITGIDTLHAVTITDRNGCTASATMTVEMLSAACGTCTDGLMNGDETSVDCGGTCDPCPVDTVNMNPLQLTKAANFEDENSNGFAEVGETITYVFSVCNAGTTQLTQISIDDPLITVAGGPVILEAGSCDASSFMGSYTITAADLAAGMIMNQATAMGFLSDTIMVTDLSDDPNNQEDVDTEDDGEPDDPTTISIEEVGECGLENVDTDDDGVCDALDEDDDGDGVNDDDDAFPFDSFESLDTDNDGFGNNADADDDNDGVDDRNDAFPLDATESLDTDGDGIGNEADNNDDGDACDDIMDTDPLVASEDCVLDVDCNVNLGNDSLLVFGGNITTDIGVAVDSAFVNITRVGDNVRLLTDVNGDYNSNTLPTLFNYQIRPEKTDLPFLGTSTLDMLFVQRHVLRLDTLETPYKVIAADVSGNQEVSIVDIIVMRRMILGIVDEWNDGVEWKFVDANTSFFDPAKPWPFDRVIEDANAGSSSCDNDFIGIKIGDVDNSFEKSDTREDDVQTLKYTVSQSERGTTLYSFSLAESTELFGFQFSLENIGYSGLNMTSNVIDINHDHFNINNNNLNVAWTNPYGQHIDASTILFTMELPLPNNSLQLNNNKSRLTPEIYAGDNINTKTIILQKINITDHSQFSISPNPFSDHLTIQLDTEQLSKVDLTIFNIEGKSLWTLHKQYQKGHHQVQVPSAIFDVSGMYYYSVMINGEVRSGKLVKQ